MPIHVATNGKSLRVSPEREAVLLSGWAEPVAAGSGGGVDRPQCEEGLHVISSA